MKLDLRKDSAALMKLLDSAAKAYTKLRFSKPKQYPQLTRIDLVFWLGDGVAAAYVLLNLDSRTGSEPDGHWSHGEFATLECPHWGPAMNALFDGDSVEAHLPNGLPQLMTCGTVHATIGEFLVAVIRAARLKRLLNRFPLAEDCEFGVEESGGGFGWPRYDDRGKENLVSGKPSAKPKIRHKKPPSRKESGVQWKSDPNTGDLVLLVSGQEAGRIRQKQLQKIKSDKEKLFYQRELLEVKAGLGRG
jgi:hypothetical protein